MPVLKRGRTMKTELKQAFDAEMSEAARRYHNKEFNQAFKHLEVAHVLGQRYMTSHVLTHWWMLKIGLKRRSRYEVVGQCARIVLGALGFAVRIVPTGNTGGTNISMFKRLPIASNLHDLVN